MARDESQRLKGELQAKHPDARQKKTPRRIQPGGIFFTMFPPRVGTPAEAAKRRAELRMRIYPTKTRSYAQPLFPAFQAVFSYANTSETVSRLGMLQGSAPNRRGSKVSAGNPVAGNAGIPGNGEIQPAGACCLRNLPTRCLFIHS